MKTLAAAIARQHLGEDGLRALYLPDQMIDLAREIVRSANARRPQEVPFAILVSDIIREDLSDADCLSVGMGRSIQYRRDNRLAVVCGEHSVPASFSSSFGTGMDGDFPGEEGTTRNALIRALAVEAFSLVLEAGKVDGSFVDIETAIDRLASAFTVLAQSHERLAQGVDAWNVYWLSHIGAGLEVLTKAAEDRVGTESFDTADEFLAETTYASFGLPRPASGTTYGHGRKVDEALLEHWSTTEGIALTLDRLRHHPSRPEDTQGQPHALEDLSFANFGQTVASKDNLLLAWGTPQEDVQAWVSAFAALNEGEFFSPQQGVDSALRLYASGGNHQLGIAGDGSPQIVVFRWEESAAIWRSEALRVVLPTSYIPDAKAVRHSAVTLKVTGSGIGSAVWIGKLLLDAGELIAEGSVVIPRAGAYKMAAKPVSLSTVIPVGDPLASCVGAAVSPGIYPVVEDTVGVWTFDAKGATGEYKPGVYRGYETMTDALGDAGANIPIESTAGTRVRVVAWGAEPSSRFKTEGIRVDQIRLAVSVTDPDLVTTSEDQLSVGQLVVRWKGGTSSTEFLSPLLAAARHGVVSAGEPDVEIQRSLRGRVETYLARSIGAESTLDAHGHMALFEDLPDLPDNLEPAADGAVLVPEGRGGVLQSHIGFSVSAELRASPEASRFRDAIIGLGLPERLLGDHGADPIWPSRTSWSSALASEALEEYLEAYVTLIERASAGTPQDLYWAAFPFSVSVYATDGTKKSRAVLLSPLHPLRLAWLAAAEDCPSSGDVQSDSPASLSRGTFRL